ncbi:uncharacterized protein LOC126892962 isoform X2 [Diabrotica virgifera virgifera]|uniref:Uncharacterized protein n=1 Tax=Diabrotica virgifera virgifera TaxID=50390 RepID=A0ABM5L8V3_DIAVI|nr:uncharacterized protein LOC126892962 isoform X2 [Diabrotica virgifera virgifera]
MALVCKVIVAAFVVFFFCDANAFEQLNELYLEHLNRSKVPCGEPQQRAVYLEEILSKDVWNKYKKWIKKMKPLHTILHRCEGSGGCNKHYGYRCKENETDPVNLVYYLGYRDDLVKFTVLNHTSCICGKYNDS